MNLSGLKKVRTTHKGELVYNCPQCKRPKLFVNPSKKLWHCFKCKTAGRLSGKELEHVSGYVLQAQEQPEQSTPDYPIVLPLSKQARAYLRQRNVNEQTIRRFGIVEAVGDPDPGSRNRWKGRILCHIFTDGEPIYWVGRTYRKGDTRTRYLYPRGITKRGVVGKTRPFRGRNKTVAIVEGIFDLFAFQEIGVPSVCLFGCEVTKEQVRQLYDVHPSKFVVYLDPDSAGRLGVRRLLYELSSVVPTVVADLDKDPGDHDPRELLHTHRRYSATKLS